MADDVIDPNTYNDISRQWTEFLNQPGGRAAILSAGLALSQPRHWGQDNFGHLMSAVGTGGEAVGRVEELNRKEREVTAKEDVAQARLEAATARSGQAETRAAAQDAQIKSRTEIENMREFGRLRARHDKVVGDAEKRFSTEFQKWRDNPYPEKMKGPPPVKPPTPSFEEYLQTDPTARSIAEKAGYQVPVAPQREQGAQTQDQAALNWANANPNDPRAVAIKRRLGVQ